MKSEILLCSIFVIIGVFLLNLNAYSESDWLYVINDTAFNIFNSYSLHENTEIEIDYYYQNETNIREAISKCGYTGIFLSTNSYQTGVIDITNVLSNCYGVVEFYGYVENSADYCLCVGIDRVRIDMTYSECDFLDILVNTAGNIITSQGTSVLNLEEQSSIDYSDLELIKLSTSYQRYIIYFNLKVLDNFRNNPSYGISFLNLSTNNKVHIKNIKLYEVY